MKNRRQWLVIAAVIVVLAVSGLASMKLFGTPARVRFVITGSPNMSIVGTCTADDKELKFGPHKGPNTVQAKGRSISYLIENIGEEGPMTVEVFVNDESRGSIAADQGYTVIRGTVENGKITQQAEQRKKD